MNDPTLTVRVERKVSETTEIARFELVSLDNVELPSFSAGAHIDLQIAPGLSRQYSLCNNPKERTRYVLGVLRDPKSRGGSIAMHDAVVEGTVLKISHPKNHFPLAAGAQKSVLFAGGVGITPILSMAEVLTDRGEEFEMHYCTRSKERAAFKDRIATSRFTSKVSFHFDDGDESQRLDMERLLSAPSRGVHIYVCGPLGFMDAVLETARKSGWPEEQLHYEFFAAKAHDSTSDTSFEIKVASSGQIVAVNKDQSIVQALASAGIEVPTSCEQGVCGTCLTRVIAGVPEHKDMFLSAEERARNDQMLLCCSRSQAPLLVLDL